MRKLLLGVFACGLVASPACAEKVGKAEQAAIAASPEAVADTVGIQGLDDLDTDFILSTQPFLPSRYGHDHFLRAFINKKTGDTSFQVYFWEEYSGEWKMLSSANYETADGPVTVEVRNLDKAVLACGRFGCSSREDVAFDVPETVLRSVSAGATGGSGAVWRYKVSGKFGAEPAQEMLKTEIAGLLIKVDQMRRTHKLPAPSIKAG